MFLNIKSMGKVVCDFQLIYETDSYIHLDLYADGLVMESTVLFNKEPYLKKENYGMVIGESKQHIEYISFFESIIKKEDVAKQISQKMINSILSTHKICRRSEREIEQGVLKPQTFLDLYTSLSIMLAFKSFSDKCNPEIFSNDRSQFQKMCLKVRIPSHITTFTRELSNLSKYSNNKSLQKFIKRYSFLQDFNIRETELETVEGLKAYLDIERESYKFKKRKLEKIDISKDSACTIFKRIGWYEEVRHYYQLRGLRNLRIFLTSLNMDIYRTSISSLKEELYRREFRHGNLSVI
jgi:hypothetical protein